MGSFAMLLLAAWLVGSPARAASDPTIYADPNEPGTTTAGIQEAIDSCGSGAEDGGGCIVHAPCSDEELNISSKIEIGDPDTAADRQDVITLRGCGAGLGLDKGTQLEWHGDNGQSGAMLEVAGQNHVIQGIAL
jgi:hypothetical protein